LQCAREHQCYQLDPSICYCGTSNLSDCQGAVGPNGPCIGVYDDAAKSTQPSAVLLAMTNPALPLGNAGDIQQCDIAFCGICF
jgi:hypothetical protein